MKVENSYKSECKKKSRDNFCVRRREVKNKK